MGWVGPLLDHLPSCSYYNCVIDISHQFPTVRLKPSQLSLAFAMNSWSSDSINFYLSVGTSYSCKSGAILVKKMCIHLIVHTRLMWKSIWVQTGGPVHLTQTPDFAPWHLTFKSIIATKLSIYLNLNLFQGISKKKTLPFKVPQGNRTKPIPYPWSSENFGPTFGLVRWTSWSI